VWRKEKEACFLNRIVKTRNTKVTRQQRGGHEEGMLQLFSGGRERG